MSAPIFGIDFLRMNDEARPVVAADLSTVGIIGPADAADPDIFPLDTPVKMESDDILMAGYLGDSGYIPDALRALNDQLAPFEFAARVVIVRTASGTDEDDAVKLQQTISNVVGDSLDGTGLHAFLKAPSMLGFTPRIIIAPGYTSQMANGVGVTTRTSAGSGYIEGESYDIVFSGGGANAVQATGHALGLNTGGLGLITLDTPGAWYTSAPTVAAEAPPVRVTATYTVVLSTDHVASLTQTNPGMGYVNGQSYDLTFSGGTPDTPAEAHALGQPDGTLGPAIIDVVGVGYDTTPTVAADAPPAGSTATYTAAISAGANPVVAALPGVLNQLIAHAIVESAGVSQQNDFDWRETFQSDRLIPISGAVRVLDPTTDSVVFRPFAPRVAGLLVARDHETGAPFHSAANQPVQGIIGPARDMAFSLTDGANEAQEMLSANIGVLVRGEVGNEFAIASGGFVFIGTDNAGEDELWRFYNVTRGRDFIHLSFLRALRFFLGRFNITGHTVQAILNTMDSFLNDLQANDHILGHRMSFRSRGNSAEQIRLGHLTVGFKAEEPPVLRRITVESYRYRPAIDAMISNLEAQINLGA
jgi:phage tail sheath protein FI